jgi:hypothetical protein
LSNSNTTQTLIITVNNNKSSISFRFEQQQQRQQYNSHVENSNHKQYGYYSILRSFFVFPFCFAVGLPGTNDKCINKIEQFGVIHNIDG